MNQPQESPQTPLATILFPLGAVLLVGAVLALIYLSSGPVSTVLGVVVAIMGGGIIWQGFKNLKQGRQ